MDNKNYKLYKELKEKAKSGAKLTPDEVAKLAILEKMMKSGKGSKKDGSKGKPKRGGNDPTWYKAYSGLYESVTNIPFNNQAGTKEPYGDGATALVPGCVRIEGIQNIGKSHTMDDAFNYQCRLLWIDMHRKYRGIGTYEASDLGCALFAIMDFFGQIERAKRVYGALMNYNVYNRNLPETVLKALHIDYSNINGDDLADFRADLNRLIIAAKSLCLPKGIMYLDYLTENFGNVFKDSDSIRATSFVYDSDYYCVFSGTYLPGSSVRYFQHTGITKVIQGVGYRAATLSNIIGDLQVQLNGLLEDLDVQRMCSDFIAAYKEGEVVTLTDLEESYIIEPIKDETRLIQLHNCKFAGAHVIGDELNSSVVSTMFDNANSVADTYTIYQIGNVLHQSFGAEEDGLGGTKHSDVYGTSMYAAPNEPYAKGDTLLDTWEDAPTADDIMEMTRLSNCGEWVRYGSTSDYRLRLDSYGVFLPTTWEIYSHFNNNALIDPYWTDNTTQVQVIPKAYTLVNLTSFMNVWKVDWAPLFYIADNISAMNTSNFVGIIGDFVNIKSISFANLRRLHDCAILSLFKVPQVTVKSE